MITSNYTFVRFSHGSYAPIGQPSQLTNMYFDPLHCMASTRSHCESVPRCISRINLPHALHRREIRKMRNLTGFG